MVLLFLLPGVAGAPLTAAAEMTCHCFRERSFDPGNPSRVDPYVLATTQNSFFAAAFDIPKKAVVSDKMAGVAGEDLWVAHFAAERLKLSPESLLSSRKGNLPWREVLGGAATSLSPLGEPFLDALQRGDPDASLAALAVRATLESRLGIDGAEVTELFRRGALPEEVIASSFLARWSGRKAQEIFEEIHGGRSTWGREMSRLAISPERIGTVILESLK